MAGGPREREPDDVFFLARVRLGVLGEAVPGQAQRFSGTGQPRQFGDKTIVRTLVTGGALPMAAAPYASC